MIFRVPASEEEISLEDQVFSITTFTSRRFRRRSKRKMRFLLKEVDLAT